MITFGNARCFLMVANSPNKNKNEPTAAKYGGKRKNDPLMI